jgi:hypothetical protein
MKSLHCIPHLLILLPFILLSNFNVSLCFAHTKEDIDQFAKRRCVLNIELGWPDIWSAAKFVQEFLKVIIFTPLGITRSFHWAGCLDSRRSNSGYCAFLDHTLVSWSSKCQTTVFHSIAKAISWCCSCNH